MSEGRPTLVRLGPRVAEIRLCRAAHANRLQRDDLTTLQAHLKTAESDSDLAALVLTADGDHFSAGFDLRALREDALTEHRSREDVDFEGVANRLADSRLATVVALNGPAIGGATDLVLACDIRFGVAQSSLRMPAARFGLPLYAGALERYVINFGLSRAKSLVMSGRTIDAQELLAAGLLTKIVTPDALGECARRAAADLAEAPHAPLAAMKAALNDLAAVQIDRSRIRASLASVFDGAEIVARIDAARAAAKASKGAP